MRRIRLIAVLFMFAAAMVVTGAGHAGIPTPAVKPDADAKPARTIARPVNNDQSIALYKPLSQKETALYTEAFAHIAAGEWDRADRLAAQIDNPVLFGHLEAQRLLHPDSNPSTDDMRRWLTAYGDHPQAPAIARRAGVAETRYKRRVTGTMAELRYFARGSKYISAAYTGGQRYEVDLVKREIEKYLDRGAATAALSFFEKHRVNDYIDPIDKSQIMARIAAVYLYLGHESKAEATARRAAELSAETPIAPWILGLTAWIRGDMDTAARQFTKAADADYASPWMVAAAAYWAARASTRAGLYRDVSGLLARAVRNQRTFYGLIATKALGYGFDFNWTMPDYTDAMRNRLMTHEAGRRAAALAAVGRYGLAEAELFALPVKTDPKLAEAAIALAHHYNLAGFAMRFSLALPNPAGGYYDAGLFPVSTWTKDDSATDDKTALLNAFIRQESRFDAMARNATGATGLMQIMPSTAAFVTGDDGYETPKGRDRLAHPPTNVSIGRDYLDHLLELDVVGGDLFGLAIAYNAGPGKLGRWKRDIRVDDPLLFIELIPSSETRAFVERIMTNYWIYQMQAGREPETLAAVAAGQWPEID